MRRTKVLIVDDHPLVRQGLAFLLSARDEYEVCGEAETESEAIAIADETKPDLLIVDISLKTGNGIDLIKQITQRQPKLKILVISAFQESLYAERALRAGAMGFLNKQETQSKLLEAIGTVLRGERYVSPELSRRLISQALTNSNEAQEPTQLLTNRELEVFRMIGQGMTSGAIANQLHLSRHTIDTHRENIKRKLGAKDAGELNRQAVQWLLENG
jgi:DNA-binding NarL/FixJ family response regulator